MKLVDVDKANIPIMQRKDDGWWVFKFNLKEVLDTLPTVDAIPVEWVNRWLEDHTKYWQAVSRNGENIPMRDTPYQVEELLEDWEKENE